MKLKFLLKKDTWKYPEKTRKAFEKFILVAMIVQGFSIMIFLALGNVIGVVLNVAGWIVSLLAILAKFEYDKRNVLEDITKK